MGHINKDVVLHVEVCTSVGHFVKSPRADILPRYYNWPMVEQGTTCILLYTISTLWIINE